MNTDTPTTQAAVNQSSSNNESSKLLNETKLLKDTLDLLWNKTLEQRQVCEHLEQENDYLQDYVNNLMSSSNVLNK